jgi:hypothetical protein
MILRSPTDNENGFSSLTSVFRPVGHSRMLLAGIQAESGLDPRLKHSGVTVMGTRTSSRQPQFSKERTKVTKDSEIDNFDFLPSALSSTLLRACFAAFVVKCFYDLTHG